MAIEADIWGDDAVRCYDYYILFSTAVRAGARYLYAVEGFWYRFCIIHTNVFTYY